MNEVEEVTEDWSIVFGNARGETILTPFLQDGFQHCYAMKRTEGGLMWHIVDCARSHLTVSLEPMDKYPHPRAYAGRDSVIIPVTAIIDVKQVRGTLGIFNCVEVVKAVLGIKETWIWTPYQLFKYLKGYKDG